LINNSLSEAKKAGKRLAQTGMKQVEGTNNDIICSFSYDDSF